MSLWKVLAPVCVGALLCASFAPGVKADDWNWTKRTTFTTNEPMQISDVVLPAGSYVFQLANSDVERTLVEIFNADGTHLIAFVQAIPAYRAVSTNDTRLVTDEGRRNGPPVITEWFYPGEQDGLEFPVSK
jgi:hypothetical protein